MVEAVTRRPHIGRDFFRGVIAFHQGEKAKCTTRFNDGVR